MRWLTLALVFLVGVAAGWATRAFPRRTPEDLVVVAEPSDETPRRNPPASFVRDEPLVERPQPNVERRFEPAVDSVDSDSTADSNQRIEELEREIMRLRDQAEPRLGSDRLRVRTALVDAVYEQGLPHADVFRDMADFVAAPHLIREDPVGYLNVMERLVLATNVHRVPRIEEGKEKRARPLGPEGGEVSVARYLADDTRFRDALRVEWIFPGSLPLPHVSHFEYKVYASFDESGALSYASIGRAQGTEFKFGRRQDKTYLLTEQGVDSRSKAELEAFAQSFEGTLKRLANLLLE